MVSTTEPLNFFDHLDQIKNTYLQQKEPLLFLDYDGTLTPIVETPDKAILSPDMKSYLEQLSNNYRIAIVSGRATDDVRKKVDLDHLYYAGSHGFEIVQPDGSTQVNQEATKVRETIDRLSKEFEQKLQHIPGMLVENVKYTLTVHYRRVEEKYWAEMKEVVAQAVNQNNHLKMTEGKMIFEVRPNLDWHKGKAVEWILAEWNFDPQQQCPIYIGDDVTDEDAFRFLADKGFGIHVADEQRATAAQYFVASQAKVKNVLEKLEKLCPILRGN